MTDKPNYNDGNWHGWNGGECPVHPRSQVEWFGPQGHFGHDGCISGYSGKASAGAVNRWGGPSPLVAFRVVKEHREPREFWLGCAGGYRHTYDTLGEAQTYKAQNKGAEIIHVREVLP